MKTFLQIVKENIVHRKQMWALAKHHQRKKYRGSDMGLMWAFAKPMMYIFVFYFAISIGFKSAKNIAGIYCPYFVWLSIGLISFFLMRDMILGGASCFRKYGEFVSKAKYPISTLPTTITVSTFLIHLGMFALGVFISIMFGNWPSIYWLQIPFYMALMLIMAIFWSMATGLLSVIYRDFYNLLQVVNTAVFWLSAILFDINTLPVTAQKVFMFNPICYIVEGYRNAFCRRIWFWQEPMKLACYLIVLLVMIGLAVLLYKKLRKRIPDVL